MRWTDESRARGTQIRSGDVGEDLLRVPTEERA